MMKTQVFDSLLGKKVEFVPLVPGRVSLYCCGPTVYGDPHIGNFRPVIVFDELIRYFKAAGYKTTYVSNYTDVDDKIIRRAKQLGISEKELSEQVIASFARLVEEVGSSLPDITPRPTLMMDEIISYVTRLVEKGFAYVRGGDVYFRVRKVKEYGELCHNSIDALESGARIEPSSVKEDPLDFALWKKTDEGIKWDSPWGKGRPGWHTECCVMIDSLFRGENGFIDIHGGGFDLKFPHHENERAQSFAQNGNGLAHYWMHNGFIDIVGEKMSKSLGNVILMKDVVSTYGGKAFRLMVLSTHYRAPLSYADDKMEEARERFLSLASTVRKLKAQLVFHGLDEVDPDPSTSRLLLPLSDDLNTPNALSLLYEEQKEANQALRLVERNKEAVVESLRKIRSSLILLGLDPEIGEITADDKKLYMDYNEARKAKDYARSDELRAVLLQKGLL